MNNAALNIVIGLALLGGVDCGHESNPKAARVLQDTGQDARMASGRKEIPVAIRERLVGEALRVARESGRRTDGMDIGIAEWSDSWMVWFSSNEKTRERASDFAVKIYKDGNAKPRLLKGQ